MSTQSLTRLLRLGLISLLSLALAGLSTPVAPALASPASATPWNTFLGSSSNDSIWNIAIDGSGKLYVVGNSPGAWGNPIVPYAGGVDAFVACLGADGQLLWHTFLGSAAEDRAYDIALDAAGNIYVIGESTGGWGNPISPYVGAQDAFVAKLNSAGARQWLTFLGSTNQRVYVQGIGLAIGGDSREYEASVNDASLAEASSTEGSVYVLGASGGSWGTPISPYAGTNDFFVAKLTSEGQYQWHTFGGSNSFAYSIAMDGSGSLYVLGASPASWGAPLSPYAGDSDVFVAKYGVSGQRQWHTFLGGPAGDQGGYSIVTDAQGFVYLTGSSRASWGTPVHPHRGDFDGFVAKLAGNGALVWHTFLGSGAFDIAHGLALDGGGDLYVAGYSNAAWGAPIRPHAGQLDAFVAALSGNGALRWNTFMGGAQSDYGRAVALNAAGAVYAAGDSSTAWGAPIRPHAGIADGFVARLGPERLLYLPALRK